MNHGHYPQPNPFYQPQGGVGVASDEPSRVISKDELKRVVAQVQAPNAPPQQPPAHNPFAQSASAAPQQQPPAYNPFAQGASAAPQQQPPAHNPFAQGTSAAPQQQPPAYNPFAQAAPFAANPAQPSEIITHGKIRDIVQGNGQGAHPGQQQVQGPGPQGPPREPVFQLTATQYQEILNRLSALEQALRYNTAPVTHGQQPNYGHHQQPQSNYGHHQQPQPNYGHHQQPQPNYGQHQQPQPNYGQHQQPQPNYGHHQQPQSNYGQHQQPQPNYGQHQQPPTRPDLNAAGMSFGA